MTNVTSICNGFISLSLSKVWTVYFQQCGLYKPGAYQRIYLFGTYELRTYLENVEHYSSKKAILMHV